MNRSICLLLILIGFSIAGTGSFRDGVMTGSENTRVENISSRTFTVVDSFTGPFGYSGGLAFDGRYIWNLDAWSPPCSIARIDPLTHSVVTMFTPAYGDRDMAFDGTYLWASHWNTNSIYKYDTANLAILASYDPPFAGHAHGLAWDGEYLWVGEESGRIYKMNTAGDTIRSIPFNAPYSYDPRGLGFAAGHLWVGHQGYGRIYEIDTISGAILNWYPAPGYVPGWNFQQGVDFGGGYLWTTTGGTYNRIYKIDIGLANVAENNQAIERIATMDIKPNPCMNNALISLTLKQPAMISIVITDVTGREVTEIINNQLLGAGKYYYGLPADLNSKGVYFVVLKANGATKTRKLINL